jgi:transcriptional regulator with XRE-family HTH domain
MESSEIKKVFTSNLRKYRNLNHMTQTELSIAADISVGFLCDLESGKKWGTLETMAKLAKALHIKPYQLLMPEDEKDQTVNIHEDLSELSQNLKHSIDSQIEALIKQYAD